MSCLPKSWTNELSVPQCHWEISFQDHLATKTLSYWIKLCLPGEWLEVLSYENGSKHYLPEVWTDELGLPQFCKEIATETIQLTGSCISKENGSKLCLLREWLEAVFLWDLSKWAESSLVSLRNSLFDTILLLKLLYWLQALSPGRMAQMVQSSLSLRPEEVSQVFPSITQKWPFQDHFCH